MIAAFCYWGLVTQDHVNILVALVIIVIVGAGASGALVERGADAPAARRLGRTAGDGHPRPAGDPHRVRHRDLGREHHPPGGQHGQRPVPTGGDQHPVPGSRHHRRGCRRGRCSPLPLLLHPHRRGSAGRRRRPRAVGHVRCLPQPDEPVRLDPRLRHGRPGRRAPGPHPDHRAQHRGHDPAGGQRLRRRHRRSPQEHPGDLRRRHRHRSGRKLRPQLRDAPPAPEPGARHHRGPAHDLPVHRSGHPTLGAAAGGGPAHHHPGAPGGRGSGVVHRRHRLLRGGHRGGGDIRQHRGPRHHRPRPGRRGHDARAGGAVAGPVDRLLRADLAVPVLVHGHRRFRHGQDRRRRLRPRTGVWPP